ncbi:hypothetical protein K0U83_16035, partial [bacterium]|nr:hypothetical protein [bacterium]
MTARHAALWLAGVAVRTRTSRTMAPWAGRSSTVAAGVLASMAAAHRRAQAGGTTIPMRPCPLAARVGAAQAGNGG